MKGSTNLFASDHLGISRSSVLEEDVGSSLSSLQVGEGLDAVHDPFLRILVDGNRSEMRLTHANDRGHDQHGLSMQLWLVIRST